MKAAIYKKYGRADELKIEDVDKPVPNKNQVLIEMHASTVNRTDEGFRRANYFVSRFFTGLNKPKREIWGSEFAGKIIEIGSDVTNFTVGERVFGFDDLNGSAHAEYMVFDSNGSIAKIPKDMKYLDVSAAGEGATYALNYIEAAKIKKGQNVLVYGASGAIGSAAVQILKHIGVNVTAVCGTINLKKIKDLGADKVIDYEKEYYTQIDETFDLIFDAVGKSSYGACKNLLKPGGMYCSSELGFALQNPLLAIWFSITGSHRVIFPIPKINKEKIDYIQDLLSDGAYKPLVDKVYDFEDIVTAAKYVETGQKAGNVVIKMK